MDIKPFNQPMPDFWSSMEPWSFIIFGLAVVALLGAVFLLIVGSDPLSPVTLVMVAFCFSLIGLTTTSASMSQKHTDHYNTAVSELKGNLADDGFKIISGTPDLNPNKQSSMLLSYEGKNFDCTMFSPEDVNTNVVFSCGEAKLTLTEVKNNVSK